MIKLMNIFSKKPGMSSEDFKTYYEANHAPLITSLIPHFTDYRRNFVKPSVQRLAHLPQAPKTPDIDCFTIAWFEDQASYNKVLEAFQNKAIADRVAKDEAQFLDRTRMILFPMEEHISSAKDLGAAAEGAPDDGSMVKTISLLKRKPGMSLAAFKDYYESTHVPLATKHMRMIAGYRRSYMIPGGTFAPEHVKDQPTPPDFDVLLEMWFRTPEDYAALGKAVVDPKLGPIFAEDEKNFLDRDNIVAYAVEERVTTPAQIAAARQGLRRAS